MPIVLKSGILTLLESSGSAHSSNGIAVRLGYLINLLFRFTGYGTMTYVRIHKCLTPWPRGLGRSSTATRFLGLRVRILSDMIVFLTNILCGVGRGPFAGLITHPEESCRLCMSVCRWVWSVARITFCTYSERVEIGHNKE